MSTPTLNLGNNMILSTDMITRGLSISTKVSRTVIPSATLNGIVQNYWKNSAVVATLFYGMLMELCATFDKFVRTEERAPQLVNTFISEYARSVYALSHMDGYDWVGMPEVKSEFILPMQDQPLFLVKDDTNTIACLAFTKAKVTIFGTLDNVWSLTIPQYTYDENYTEAEYLRVMWYYAALIILHKLKIWASQNNFGGYNHKPAMMAEGFSNAVGYPGILGLANFIELTLLNIN